MAVVLDNQAAIRATNFCSSIPGAYLLDALDAMLQHSFQPTGLPASRPLLRWVPGHKNVRGNEAANREANKAAHANTMCTASLSTFLVPTILQERFTRQSISGAADPRGIAPPTNNRPI
jgi:hypothetical protein